MVKGRDAACVALMPHGAWMFVARAPQGGVMLVESVRVWRATRGARALLLYFVFLHKESAHALGRRKV
jgi:hypothetical protein